MTLGELQISTAQVRESVNRTTFTYAFHQYVLYGRVKMKILF